MTVSGTSAHSDRITEAVLVAAVPPLMLQTPEKPDGVPLAVFNGLRQASLSNRSQLYRDIASGPFFGFNRAGAQPSAGLIESFWMQGMMGGHKNTYDSIAAFSATDFTADLRKFDVPTLVIHGDDDQIVPLARSGLASAQLVKDARLIVYPGAPHGLTDTHKDWLNADLLDFIRDSAAQSSRTRLFCIARAALPPGRSCVHHHRASAGPL